MQPLHDGIQVENFHPDDARSDILHDGLADGSLCFAGDQGCRWCLPIACSTAVRHDADQDVIHGINRARRCFEWRPQRDGHFPNFNSVDFHHQTPSLHRHAF